MYDTLYSFTMILLGSLVIDNHHLTDKERVNFMASGKVLNLFAAFFVARIGLEIFDTNDMHQFRIFLVLLALFVAVLFLVSQIMIHYHVVVHWKAARIRFSDVHRRQNYTPKRTERLKPQQVARDFWRYRNFWAWIGMELFLESQNSFSNAFLKTFVDRLVHDAGVSREGCDWLLSTIRPLGLICTILCYIPIRRLGYKKVYPILFATNIGLCLFMWFGADHNSTGIIIAFLIIYPAITGAVASAGFHLVMSDMVLEMKKMHAVDGRLDEASLAGLFMGVNALFCKPAESILPVVAANMLDKLDFISEENEDAVQRVLFKLLILPPLVFSSIEWISWRRYTLTPAATNQMREDLRKLEQKIHRSPEEVLA
jgi:Na+/melibiose symporter-like transporter